jgi:hypothetical protein
MATRMNRKARKTRMNRKARKTLRKSRRMSGGSQDAMQAYKSPFVTNMVRY